MANKVARKPMTMAELLPEISVLLPEDARITLTAKKKPPPMMTQKAHTTEKMYKPMNLAEMFHDIKGLKAPSPKRDALTTASSKKRWNSSVRVEKGKSTVRKVLDFQPKSKLQQPKAAGQSETPKFQKPEFRAKKSILKPVNTIRISGICNIQETPSVTNKPFKRMTLASKENKNILPSKPANRIIFNPPIPETPVANKSWKSSCDESFLLKEKEINDCENKNILVEKNIKNTTPHISTPFTKHRDVQEYFNNSSTLDDSAAYRDNTIMCFDKPSNPNANKHEESVIVSLCDLLNKATVADIQGEKPLDDLLSTEKQFEQNLNNIDNAIKILNELKETQIQSIKCIRKLINERKVVVSQAFDNMLENMKTEKEKDDLSETKDENDNKSLKIDNCPRHSPIGKPCSVIKSCGSPSYKIPKKSPCLKRVVVTKFAPNKSNELPCKGMNKHALSMYMGMKQHLNFLNTPSKKPQMMTEPDTPAVTSHNLQLQLQKLFGSDG